jgi:hypothetical protein
LALVFNVCTFRGLDCIEYGFVKVEKSFMERKALAQRRDKIKEPR